MPRKHVAIVLALTLTASPSPPPAEAGSKKIAMRSYHDYALACRAYRDIAEYDPDWGDDAGFDLQAR